MRIEGPPLADYCTLRGLGLIVQVPLEVREGHLVVVLDDGAVHDQLGVVVHARNRLKLALQCDVLLLQRTVRILDLIGPLDEHALLRLAGLLAFPVLLLHLGAPRPNLLVAVEAQRRVVAAHSKKRARTYERESSAGRRPAHARALAHLCSYVCADWHLRISAQTATVRDGHAYTLAMGTNGTLPCLFLNQLRLHDPVHAHGCAQVEAHRPARGCACAQGAQGAQEAARRACRAVPDRRRHRRGRGHDHPRADPVGRRRLRLRRLVRRGRGHELPRGGGHHLGAAGDAVQRGRGLPGRRVGGQAGAVPGRAHERRADAHRPVRGDGRHGPAACAAREPERCAHRHDLRLRRQRAEHAAATTTPRWSCRC